VQALWLVGLSLLVSGAWAQAPAGTAHGIVDNATQQVMAVVMEASEYADEDPERYYQEVQAILDPVIDFRGFARSVMGPYATSERYRSLDAQGQARLRDQLDRFTQVMRLGLVRTYSKGLLAYGGSRIEVVAASDEEEASGRATVRQLVYSGQAEPYVLLYQMGRDKAGAWQLRNIIIESVNLGEIYRNQFIASAREYDGDLDAVIDNWTTVEVESEGEQADAESGAAA
jgi:phospholipid transport system substrate-binding protein